MRGGKIIRPLELKDLPRLLLASVRTITARASTHNELLAKKGEEKFFFLEKFPSLVRGKFFFLAGIQ